LPAQSDDLGGGREEHAEGVRRPPAGEREGRSPFAKKGDEVPSGLSSAGFAGAILSWGEAAKERANGARRASEGGRSPPPS